MLELVLELALFPWCSDSGTGSRTGERMAYGCCYRSGARTRAGVNNRAGGGDVHVQCVGLVPAGAGAL